MNKPTIPNEVADVIDGLRKSWTDEWIIECWFRQRDRGSFSETLRTISLSTLMAALVNGYEREMTEEQRHQNIKERYELYRFCEGHYDTSLEDAAHADGIRYALNMLDIKIEGVNA